MEDKKLEGIVQGCTYHRMSSLAFKIGENNYFIDSTEFPSVPLVNGAFVKGTALGGYKIPKNTFRVKEMDVFDKKDGTLLYSLKK